jgi:hypothetical protein
VPAPSTPRSKASSAERVVNGVLLLLVVVAWAAFFDAWVGHFPTLATRYVYPLMDRFDKKAQ